MMAALGVIEQQPDASDDEIREALEGNLCRCTGYQNIVASVRAAADQMARS
jgi:carbon-monoxide dehydrogenase small subunit